jgi:hypothetical protein
MVDDIIEPPPTNLNPNRQYPTLENVERFPTLRGWEPSLVPMPRKRKLVEPTPFLLMEREHQKLYTKMRPLEQANWKLRNLPEDHHRRKKIEAAISDLWPKIARLEDEMFEWAATNPATPAILMLQINMFRDWVEMRREAMVDTALANLRELLKVHGAPLPKRGARS